MKITNNNIFTILGCIIVIITTFYIYRKAKINKLNPVKWSFINLGVGFIPKRNWFAKKCYSIPLILLAILK